MSEYPRVPLVDVLEFREGPGILAKDFHEAGTPLIRLAGLKSSASLLSGCNFLDPALVDAKWSQFKLREGDTLLSTSASLGEVARVSAEGAGAVPYTGIISFRPRNERILGEFVPLALTEAGFKEQIEAMGVGSVMMHFGPSHLRQMTVALPPTSVQRAIAEVLGALDDKIAANSKIAATADEYMRTKFRTLDRRDAVPLSSTAQFVNGRAFTKGASGTGRVVIRIAELNSGVGGSTVFSDAVVDDKHVARPGDILFAWSGSLTLARWARDEAIVNQHIFKVIPNSTYPSWLVYELIRDKLDGFRAIAAGKATTMGHIQRHHLDEPVGVPSPSAIARVDTEMSAVWQRALLAEQENLTLAATRDALLPQLMSGKLRVRDAEQVAGQVA